MIRTHFIKSGFIGSSMTFRHRLYALDVELDLAAGATKAEVLDAIDGHVLAEGQLMGRAICTQMRTA